MKIIGTGADASEVVSASHMAEDPPTHHPKRAWRAWRVVMDKVLTLLLFSNLQQVVEEWFPQSPPLLGCSSERLEETQQDVCAELIVGATPLPPLEESDSSFNISKHVHSPQRTAEGRWQQVGVLHHLQGMPQQVGEISTPPRRSRKI